ncbi:MAG: GNAT family N-acetyltransferase [Gallionella sp.]|nr:GNAT family N-acetyltransferase [Gallionella sp.]MDD4958636.1 GNAT family N-acetyltransferase [Gallionella sp.]
MLKLMPVLPEPLSIRLAQDDDSAFMETLYRSTRDDLIGLGEMMLPILAQQYRAQQLGYRSTFPNAQYWIVEKWGERVGLVVMDINEIEVHLINFAFLPLARRQGNGTHVLHALQQLATQAHVSLTLNVSHTNPAALKLYLALGFVVVANHPSVSQMVWYSPTT